MRWLSYLHYVFGRKKIKNKCCKTLLFKKIKHIWVIEKKRSERERERERERGRKKEETSKTYPIIFL